MRDKIRRVSLKLFEQKGFRGTAMSDIARACGVTKAGLYHYFSTKGDLLDFIYETVNANVAAALEHASDTSIPTEERLAELVRAQVGHHVKYRAFLTVFWRERHELEPKSRERLRARERRYEETMRALLREGQEQGIFRDFDVEVRMSLVFGVLSTVYRWAHHVDKTADEIAAEVMDFILHGIAAPAMERGELTAAGRNATSS